MVMKRFFSHDNDDSQVFLSIKAAKDINLEVDMFATEDHDFARVLLGVNHLEPLVYFRCKSQDDNTFMQIEEALSKNERLLVQVYNKSGTLKDLLGEVSYLVHEFYWCVANLDTDENRSEFRWMFTCFPEGIDR